MAVTTTTSGAVPPQQTAAPTSVFLRFGNIEIAAVADPLPGNIDSGDCVGAVRVRNGAIAWLIDVESKGSVAAPLAAALHRTACEHAKNGAISLTKLLNVMHEICLAFGRSAAVTVFYIVNNTVSIGVAGMRPPILIEDGNPDVTEVPAEGMTIGFPFTPTFKLEKVDLLPGFILLTGSDGYYEAEDAEGNFFDLRALGLILNGHSGSSLSSSLVRAMDALRKHAPGQTDDRSLMMIRRIGPDGPTAQAVCYAWPRTPLWSLATGAESPLNTTEFEISAVYA